MTRRKGWPRSDSADPSRRQIESSRRGLRLEAKPLDDERVDRLLSLLNPDDLSGEARFIRMRLQGDWVAARLISCNRSDEYGLGEHILTSDFLRTRLPDLNTPETLDRKFQWATPGYSGFRLAGELAEVMWGKPVLRLSTADCKRVADDFMSAVTGDRFGDFHVLKSYLPWSDFFFQDHYGVEGLGDTTWLIIDGKNGDVSGLFCTST